MSTGFWRSPALFLLVIFAACTPIRTTIKPPYIVNGVVYDDEGGLQQYAQSQCKDSTGNNRQPPFKFTTDGCSLWPDGSWQECCVIHDVSYWCGGPPKIRSAADEELRACVAPRSSELNAFLMYSGVRLGGSRWLPFPWRWGYGYQWPYRSK